MLSPSRPPPPTHHLQVHVHDHEVSIPRVGRRLRHAQQRRRHVRQTAPLCQNKAQPALATVSKEAQPLCDAVPEVQSCCLACPSGGCQGWHRESGEGRQCACWLLPTGSCMWPAHLASPGLPRAPSSVATSLRHFRMSMSRVGTRMDCRRGHVHGATHARVGRKCLGRGEGQQGM